MMPTDGSVRVHFQASLCLSFSSPLREAEDAVGRKPVLYFLISGVSCWTVSCWATQFAHGSVCVCVCV